MGFRQGLISFVFLFTFAGLQAQDAYTIYNTSNSPLPDNWVNAVIRDDTGNHWIATEGGLAKLDTAGNWTVFTPANSGIPDYYVRSLYADDSGNIWVGTYLGGLAKFDGTDWTIYNTSNSGLPFDYVRSIAIDINDTLWIGTAGGGVAKWDGADYWYTYNEVNSNLHSSNITDILPIADGTIYLGTLNGGLSTYKDGVINYYKTDNSGIGDNTVLQLAEHDGTLWMATAFGGLSLWLSTGTFVNFTPVNSDIPSLEVNDVAIDTSGYGILAMEVAGMTIFTGSAWSIYDNSNSAVSDSLLCAEVDPDNLIWLGSQAEGVIVVDRSAISGTHDLTPPHASVFPNPARGSCLVQSPFANGMILLYDMQGHCALTQSIQAKATALDVHALAPGIYLIDLVSPEGSATAKLVVVK